MFIFSLAQDNVSGISPNVENTTELTQNNTRNNRCILILWTYWKRFSRHLFLLLGKKPHSLVHLGHGQAHHGGGLLGLLASAVKPALSALANTNSNYPGQAQHLLTRPSPKRETQGSPPCSSRTLSRTFLMSLSPVGNPESYSLHNSKSEFWACLCRRGVWFGTDFYFELELFGGCPPWNIFRLADNALDCVQAVGGQCVTVPHPPLLHRSPWPRHPHPLCWPRITAAVWPAASADPGTRLAMARVR